MQFRLTTSATFHEKNSKAVYPKLCRVMGLSPNCKNSFTSALKHAILLSQFDCALHYCRVNKPKIIGHRSHSLKNLL